MAYSILNKLRSEGLLEKCSITVSDRSSLRGVRAIFGRDIRRITRFGIEFMSGETGHERHEIPVASILEIRAGQRILYRKKKRIERIYPR